LVNYLYNNI